MNLIQSFFAAPIYADPRQDRLAKQLHLLLVLGVFITFAYTLVVYLTTQDIAGPLASGCMFFVTLGLVRLLKNGRFYFVSITVISTSYIAIMLSLVFNGGIRDQAIVVLVMLLSLTALFLGERSVIALGLLSATLLTLIYLAERMGYIRDSDYTVLVETDDLLISLIAVIITTVFLQQMIRQAGNSETQIQDQANMLQAQNNALEQNRRSLQLRTQELAATLVNLESARATAEKANQAKSAFLSSMSHELRTPLNGILGFTQILLRQTAYAAEDTQRSLLVIQQSGEHLLTLITDILDLAKIEAGKLDLVVEPFNLTQFLQGIVALMQLRAEEKQLLFRYEPSGNLPMTVVADTRRLRQVLINLLGNAIRFTAAGSITLQVHLLAEGEAGVTMRFAVRDTGVGIAADDLARIFQPFEQAGSPNQRTGGTGLGLAISHQLVELLGGKLLVESAPKQGSHFWFDLMLPLGDLPLVGEKRPFFPITGYHGPRHTVLVVDDIASNRAVLVALLEPLGFVVQEAADGETAVSLATAHPPSAIFMDLIMPGMSGQETILRLRQQPALAQTPILVISADATVTMTQLPQADVFLAKPLDADLVLTQLQQQLGLVWMQEKTPPVEAKGEALQLPVLDDLDTLYRLALAGDLTAVDTYITQLSHNNNTLHHFAQQIQHLAQNFEEEKLIDTLKAYQRTDHEPK